MTLFVVVTVQVVRVAQNQLNNITADLSRASLPRPPHDVLALWKKRSEASFLVRLFDTCHSW